MATNSAVEGSPSPAAQIYPHDHLCLAQHLEMRQNARGQSAGESEGTGSGSFLCSSFDEP